MGRLVGHGMDEAVLIHKVWGKNEAGESLWFPGYPHGTSWGRCFCTHHQWRISRYPVGKEYMEKFSSYVKKKRADRFYRDNPALSLSWLPSCNPSWTAPWHLGLILPFFCTLVLQLVLLSFIFSCPTLRNMRIQAWNGSMPCSWPEKPALSCAWDVSKGSNFLVLLRL